MAYTVGIASDYLNLFQRIRYYLRGEMSIENELADPGNTGDGYIKGLIVFTTPVIESWTITCTTGGGSGVAIFSVTGSVSGAQNPATCDTYYSNTQIEFTVGFGATDYVVDDEFTFDVIANSIPSGQEWTELKYLPGVPDGTNNGMNVDAAEGATYANELYLKGPGLAAADEIFVQMFTSYNEDSDYYNLRFQGSTGFETLDSFENQPSDSTTVTMAAWQFQIQYWIVADGRRFILTWKIDTKYMNGYFGFILPYGTPTEYPYPLYIAGCHTTDLQWGSESHNHRAFFDPYAGYIYTIEGTWLLIQNKYSSSNSEVTANVSNIWPYTENYAQNIRQSPGDVYPMLPLVMHTSQNGGNVYGELSGAFWCPGFANGSENTIVVDGIDYMVFHDVYRTLNQDYYALKLEQQTPL